MPRNQHACSLRLRLASCDGIDTPERAGDVGGALSDQWARMLTSCQHRGRVDDVMHAVWATIPAIASAHGQREDDFETTVGVVDPPPPAVACPENERC